MKLFMTAVLLTISSATFSSVAYAQPVLRELEDRVRRQVEGDEAGDEPGYLGLVADDRQTAGRGIQVLEVVPKGPAEAAGLQPDDLIIAVGDREIRTMEDLATAVEPLPPGANVLFRVDRAGETLDLEVTLGRRPPPEERRFEEFGRVPERLPQPVRDPQALGRARRAILGLRTQTVTPELAERLNLEEGGALVVARTVGSAAERTGIPLRSVIVAADGVAIESPEHLAAIIQKAGPGAEVEITFTTEEGEETVTAVLQEGGIPPGEPRPELPVLPELPPLRDRPATADRKRIEDLEARLVQLEDRIAELEDLLRRQDQHDGAK